MTDTQLPQARFDPVGEIENLPQIISELRIAGQRMEIQAGVMKQWSQRFIAFADALSEKPVMPSPDKQRDSK